MTSIMTSLFRLLDKQYFLVLAKFLILVSKIFKLLYSYHVEGG